MSIDGEGLHSVHSSHSPNGTIESSHVKSRSESVPSPLLSSLSHLRSLSLQSREEFPPPFIIIIGLYIIMALANIPDPLTGPPCICDHPILPHPSPLSSHLSGWVLGMIVRLIVSWSARRIPWIASEPVGIVASHRRVHGHSSLSHRPRHSRDSGIDHLLRRRRRIGLLRGLLWIVDVLVVFEGWFPVSVRAESSARLLVDFLLERAVVGVGKGVGVRDVSETRGIPLDGWRREANLGPS